MLVNSRRRLLGKPARPVAVDLSHRGPGPPQRARVASRPPRAPRRKSARAPGRRSPGSRRPSVLRRGPERIRERTFGPAFKLVHRERRPAPQCHTKSSADHPGTTVRSSNRSAGTDANTARSASHAPHSFSRYSSRMPISASSGSPGRPRRCPGLNMRWSAYRSGSTMGYFSTSGPVEVSRHCARAGCLSRASRRC